MSLTDKQIDILTQFYMEQILPLANDPEVTNLEHGQPNAEDPSWYVKRKNTRMGKTGFELSLTNEAGIQAALEKQWANTSMQSLPNKLMKLSQYFSTEKENENPSISAFIYEMF